MLDDKSDRRVSNLKTLRPHKHELEFFIADKVELSSFRDEVASMEHPFFAMKGGDTKVREYKNGNVTLMVRPPSVIGLATIFDKDIWIYSISKLQASINHHVETSRKVCFTPYDFFITTNRDKSGRAYEDLRKALARLAGTRIETNIIYSNDSRKTENFGLIDNWVIVEKKRQVKY